MVTTFQWFFNFDLSIDDTKNTNDHYIYRHFGWPRYFLFSWSARNNCNSAAWVDHIFQPFSSESVIVWHIFSLCFFNISCTFCSPMLIVILECSLPFLTPLVNLLPSLCRTRASPLPQIARFALVRTSLQAYCSFDSYPPFPLLN